MFDQIVLVAGAHHWRLAANALYPDAEPIINWLKLLPADGGTKHQRAHLVGDNYLGRLTTTILAG